MVTGADLHQVDFADFACPDGLADGPVVVVEAAVEAHLELDPGLLRGGDDLPHPLDPVVHRLLHKHVLPGLGHLDGVLRMEVRGGADDYRPDLGVLQDDVGVLDNVGDAQALEELHGFLAHVGVGNGLGFHLGDEFRDVLRVDPADPARSDDADFNGFHMRLSLI